MQLGFQGAFQNGFRGDSEEISKECTSCGVILAWISSIAWSSDISCWIYLNCDLISVWYIKRKMFRLIYIDLRANFHCCYRYQFKSLPRKIQQTCSSIVVAVSPTKFLGDCEFTLLQLFVSSSSPMNIISVCCGKRWPLKRIRTTFR